MPATMLLLKGGSCAICTQNLAVDTGLVDNGSVDIRTRRDRELLGLLVQGSKCFGINSAQFSSLVTSLSGTFVQVDSEHGRKCICSVRSFQLIRFISRFLLVLALVGLTGSLGLSSVHSIESPIVWGELRSSPSDIPIRRPGVSRPGGGALRRL